MNEDTGHGFRRMGMKAYCFRFTLLAVALMAIHWAAVGLFHGRILFPPTFVIGIDAGIAAGNPWAVLLISLFHLVLFALMNSYLFLHVARARLLSPMRAGLPSLIFTVLLAALSLRYWLRPIAHHPVDGPLGGFSSGLQIQGSTYVWCYAVLNLAGFALAAIALYMLMKRRSGPTAWLVYNWVLFASLYALLFPWLGGYP